MRKNRREKQVTVSLHLIILHFYFCNYISISFIFLKRFIYFIYVGTLLLSSDTPEEGVGSPLQMVVSYHVVAGN